MSQSQNYNLDDDRFVVRFQILPQQFDDGLMLWLLKLSWNGIITQTSATMMKTPNKINSEMVKTNSCDFILLIYNLLIKISDMLHSWEAVFV